LGHQNLRRIDLEAQPPVAVLGPNYIRPPGVPGVLHLILFPLNTRVCCRHAVLREVIAPPSLDPTLQHPRMRVKSLVTFRSRCIGFEEGKMEKPAIPDPSTVWEP
jgi:hypothetical protein